MELEILGSGTSHGVPVIGCTCPVCTSQDPKNNRMRTSALIRTDSGKTCIIDVGPEFRIQALRSKITSIDAVLITHSHADHIHGLDDLRVFTRDIPMPVYAERSCIQDIKYRFSYAFRNTARGGGKPHFNLIPIPCSSFAHSSFNSKPITICGIEVLPIPVYHGKLCVLGWRIENTAYITDCSQIPESSYKLLEGTKTLILGALRLRPHTTHFNFPQALEVSNRIGAKNTYLIHLCHDFSHQEICEWLASNAAGKKIEPAYDGLRITIQ